MAGENPDEPHTGAADEFLSRPKWDRFRILIAGPAMNIVLAVVLMTVVLAQGAQVPVFESDPVDVGVVTKGSPAERGGIQAGDRIIKVGSQRVATWEQFFLAIGGRAEREVPITLLREGRETVVTVTARGADEDADRRHRRAAQRAPEHPHRRGRRARRQGRPEAGRRRAGAQRRADRVLGPAVGRDPEAPRQAHHADVSARRRDARHPGDAAPAGRRSASSASASRTRSSTIQPGLLGAAKLSLERNIEFAGLIVQTLGGLFTRETSPRQLMGPVAIAQMSGDYAAAGWIALFSFMASLSLNLGLLNLLPIPVLDGGHIFIMAIEGLVRRDFSMKMKERLMLAGFVVLMLLMVTVIYNDLARLSIFDRLMPGSR